MHTASEHQIHSLARLHFLPHVHGGGLIAVRTAELFGKHYRERHS